MGVTTLPQALRLAGHLDVAQVSGPQYAISARGFSISTANKMLVMIDGRSVYSPVFAGVFWEAQDVVIADIERIEVTRGPGGSVWGANAVNGVINVITKQAADTEARSSTCWPAPARSGRTRCATAAGRRATVAIARTAKCAFEDSHQLVERRDAQDDFDFGQAGFRIESERPGASIAFAAGRRLHRHHRADGGAEANISGGNLLARWSQTSRRPHVQRRRPTTITPIAACPNQYRGVLQHGRCGCAASVAGRPAEHRLRRRLPPLRRRRSRRRPGVLLRAARAHLASPQRVRAGRDPRLARGLFVTVGSKFERNEFTGLEVQPTVRARWSAPRHSVWGAVSRAVRVPTRFDTDLRFRVPGSTTGALLLTGSSDVRIRERRRLRSRLPPAVARARLDRRGRLRQPLRRLAHAGVPPRGSRSCSPT